MTPDERATLENLTIAEVLPPEYQEWLDKDQPSADECIEAQNEEPF